MSRKNVRIEIPSSSPSKMLKLAADIIKQHNSGEPSPLKAESVEKFTEQKSLAESKREQSQEANQMAQALMQESHTAMGIAKGQTSETPGTLYNLLLLIRDQLLVAYPGMEEMLSKWGFNVVITTSTPGSKSTGEGAEDGTGDAV